MFPALTSFTPLGKIVFPIVRARIESTMVTFDETKQNERLQELRAAEQEELARMLAERHNLPYIDLSAVSINTDALRLIPEEAARAASLAAFHMTGKKVGIALLSPAKTGVADVLGELKTAGYEPEPAIASEQSIKRAWERYAEISYAVQTEEGMLDISHEEVNTYEQQFSTIDDLTDALNDALVSNARYQTTRLLELVIAGALALDASDIHIEPYEDHVMLRIRMDGILHDLLSVRDRAYVLLVSRIKLLSGLKLNVRDQAQDGRFSIKFKATEIEIRTSVIPGAYGESIVMRILNPESIRVELKDLGMRPELLAIVEREVGKPNGMILNTGPTGSGKTTTLYAILRHISTPDIKIITIEDPIEYHLAGVTQTQTDAEKGYTFLEGLRSALRQDPDVIMVGEIRDDETAGTAVNAALTGHLVLSTLHTNTAAGAIPRLIDLAVNPKIIGSSVNAILAQRLVRLLCNECKTMAPVEERDRRIITTIVAGLPQGTAPTIPETLPKPVGCTACNKTGYTGRTGIYEIVLINEAVENIIVRDASEREIRKAARSQGHLELREDGILKVLEGSTTIDELRRVVDLEEEV